MKQRSNLHFKSVTLSTSLDYANHISQCAVRAVIARLHLITILAAAVSRVHLFPFNKSHYIILQHGNYEVGRSESS